MPTRCSSEIDSGAPDRHRAGRPRGRRQGPPRVGRAHLHPRRPGRLRPPTWTGRRATPTAPSPPIERTLDLLDGLARAERVQAHLDPALIRLRPSVGHGRTTRDAQRAADVRRRGADVEPREGSAPQLVDRQRHAPRPGRPIRSGSARGSSAPRCRCPGCASAWCPPSAGWPRPSGGTNPTSTSTTTCAGRRCPTPGRCASCSTSPPPSCGTPFDRTRPLWEFLVIEGLEDGGAAMIQKLHHAIADGEGSIRMSEQFIDLARDATEPIAPGSAGARADRHQPRRDHRRHPHPPAAPRARASRAARPRASLGLLRDPRQRRRRWPSDARRARAVGHAPGASCRTRPARRCGRERSLRRRIEVLQVPIDEAKAAAKELGGSLNDFFVAGAAGGAGALPPQGRASRSTSCASRCR